VQTLHAVKFRLNILHDTYGLSWEEIANLDAFKGINKRTLYGIAKEDRDPKSPKVRTILKLPALVPVPVCPNCGVVHQRSCHKTARKRKPWMSEEEWSDRLKFLDTYLMPIGRRET
jgi:hypothetical protein